MEGNAVVGFLSVRPTGTGSAAKVLSALRWLGVAVFVGAVLSVLHSVLTLALGRSYADSGLGDAELLAGSVVGIVVTLVVTGLVGFWITFTCRAWAQGEPRAATHTLVLGVLAVVVGALGLLGALAVGGSTIVSGGLSLTARVVQGLTIPVSAVELGCGIVVLANRGRTA